MTACTVDAVEPRDAFERLTLPQRPSVLRFARSLTRDDASAEDLVQETYLHALRGWHTFRRGAEPRRWLFTVCRRLHLRTRRREARHVATDPHALDAVCAFDDADGSSSASVGARALGDAAGHVERVDRCTAIAEAIGELPSHYRAAVTLVDVHGLGYEEAAAEIGVAVGTVRSRLHRGRRRLQRALAAHAEDVGVRGDGRPSGAGR